MRSKPNLASEESSKNLKTTSQQNLWVLYVEWQAKQADLQVEPLVEVY